MSVVDTRVVDRTWSTVCGVWAQVAVTVLYLSSTVNARIFMLMMLRIYNQYDVSQFLKLV